MNETKAARYQRLRRRARAAGLLSGAVMLAALAFTPAGPRLAAWAEGSVRALAGPAQPLLAPVCFAVLLVVLWEIAALPAMLYLGLRVDRRLNGGPPAVDDVLAAQAQATLVALPVAVVVALTLEVSVRIAGGSWWLLAGVLLAAGLGAALHGAPAALARLAAATPVSRPDLAAQLAELARRARVPVAGIDEWRAGEGARTTALVTGLGRTRRIFISSDLVRDWSDTEIAVVVAHELAHHAYHDLLRTLAVDAMVLSTALGSAAAVVRWVPAAGRLEDLATLPLIALVAGGVWLAATPLRHAQSRRQERRADLFALVVTGGSGAFSSAIRRLGARHLAEERPSAITRWLFHRHPTVAERLAMAEAYQQLKVRG
ncbi:MAG TPA: M48 family metalloprotease [Vicinamibacterales bacterium]|nr:M48 family metalloprotease [Vicinamibacterales bacterium]